jgi:hypothetical protein
MQDFFARSLWEICMQGLCQSYTRSFGEISMRDSLRDLRQEPLGKIPVRDPETRSLCKIFWQDLCTRSLYKISRQDLLKRSPYQVSWQDLFGRSLIQDLFVRCLREISTQSINQSINLYIYIDIDIDIDIDIYICVQDLYTRSLWEISVQDPLARSLWGVSRQDLSARFRWKVSYMISVQGLYTSSLANPNEKSMIEHLSYKICQHSFFTRLPCKIYVDSDYPCLSKMPKRDLLTKPLYKGSVQDLLARSPGKISAQDLPARCLWVISFQDRRSLYKISLQVLLWKGL